MDTKSILSFTIGLVAGGAAGFIVTKKYLENDMNEQVEEVRKYYDSEIENLSSNKSEEVSESEQIEEANDIPEEIVEPAEELKAVVEKLNYSAFSKKETKPKKSTKKGKKSVSKDIHVIEPEDFSSDRDYDKVTLTYLEEDGIFLTIEDDKFEEALDVIGEENLDKFGEFEEGVLYVRNETLKTDYEVVNDDRSYDDYMSEEHPID